MNTVTTSYSPTFDKTIVSIDILNDAFLLIRKSTSHFISNIFGRILLGIVYFILFITNLFVSRLIKKLRREMYGKANANLKIDDYKDYSRLYNHKKEVAKMLVILSRITSNSDLSKTRSLVPRFIFKPLDELISLMSEYKNDIEIELDSYNYSVLTAIPAGFKFIPGEVISRAQVKGYTYIL
ncbi:MAG: hypothetical protein H6579_07970 [Chitinophagales bacterium]|nr:hypothetical protein [Chitinophagales bacterium]